MERAAVTGLILAGGRGSRMGGIDKGLQPFKGRALALHALDRLTPQVGTVLINCNRHDAVYAGWGVAVCADEQPQAFDGPLAGFLSGLRACHSEWLCTVPCDTPGFPVDLVQRLGQAAESQDADIAMACAPEDDGHWRPQPVFCLLRRTMQVSLRLFLQGGGRKIDAWTAQHRTALVRFDQPHDRPRAFFNANTLEELRRLEGGLS